MVKLIVLSGSARKDSFNKKLARQAAEIAKELGAKVTYIDLTDYPMPIYNGDLEAESGLPENAKKLKKLFIESDGFFIATPEYNSSLTPLLKNTLDWMSRQDEPNEVPLIAYKGKVAGLAAASPGGFGGLRGLVPLRMMLGNIGVIVVPNQLAISFADKAFDKEGNLVEDKHKSGLRGVVQQLVEVATSLAQT